MKARDRPNATCPSPASGAGSITVLYALFNPFSRTWVASGSRSARRLTAAPAIWFARCRMARHCPQRCRDNDAA